MKPAVVVNCALLLAVTLGCSSDETPEQSGGQASTETAAAVPVTPSPSSPPAASGPKPLATAEGTIPGTRVEVMELKRTSGGTVTLRFAIANESNRPLQVADVQQMLNGGASYSIGNVHLIDPVGRKKYFAAADAEGGCVCSSYSAVRPGERVNHWVKFAAPPDEVERLSVVVPSFAPLDDVPVSR